MITSVFTPDRIRLLAREPHRIGHLVGKRDLTILHSKWIRELWLPQTHTSLQAHRGAYKTTACTEIGILWWLLFHPDRRIALIRETWTEANNTLKTIAQYMNTELVAELFRALHHRYPKATTEKDGRLVFNFKSSITKEGSVDSYGVDTVPTGSHYDDVLTDDVVTIRDRYSRAKRERTRDNLMEIKNNILDPGKFMRNVGTPWHREDAWSVLPTPTKYTIHDTGILSAAQIEEKRANSTPVMFAANYLLEHISSDDAFFKDPAFDWWDKKLVKRARGHVDARFQGRHFTACTVLGQRHDGKIYVWGKVFDQNIKQCHEEIHRYFRKKEVAIVHVETNPDKGYTGELFQREVDGVSFHVEMYHENMNKDTKIQNYISEFWDRLVFTDDCDDQYIAQVLEYREKQEPNDAPDSLASLLREMIYPSDSQTAPGVNGLYSR